MRKFERVIGLAGLMLVGARLAMMPGWSARIWPLLMVGLALSGPVAVYWAHRPATPFDNSLRLLAFRDVGPPLSLRWQLILWALHLVGVTGWVRAAGWPLWWAALLWGALFVVQLLVATLITYRNSKLAMPRLSIYVAPLTPLFFAYLSGGLHLLLNLQQYPSLMPLHPRLADLWWLPFYFESMSVAAVLYTLLVDLFLLNRGINRSVDVSQAIEADRVTPRRWRFTSYILSCALIAGSLGWMAFELFSHRTHGVTGTDPYGYSQVAVDLVTRGTVLHRFDLFPHIVDLNIAWAPVIALGYHLPLNEAGDAASVWPLGISILLALAYRLLGEPGLYATGPLLAFLVAVAVGWLAVEIKNASQFGQPPGQVAKNSQDSNPITGKKRGLFTRSRLGAFVAGCLALFIWATSIEVIDRSLVPMADVAAALFTALVWIALLKLRVGGPQGFQKPGQYRIIRLSKIKNTDHSDERIKDSKSENPSNPGSILTTEQTLKPIIRDNIPRPLGTYTSLWALAAGIALGLAFDIRYTQLMLLASVVVAIGWPTAANRRQRTQLLAIAGIGALVAVLPDIIYRWRVFDSPLANPQARELTHFAWTNVIPTTTNILQQLLHGQEFGLLALFLVAGIIWQWQRDRYGFVTLAAGALAVIALQLPYESLRLRDLLPLLPLLAAWSGIGIVWVWRTLISDPIHAETMTPRLIHALVVCAIFLSLLLPIVRVEPLVTRTWQPHRASFGYVTARERVALTQLASLTPSPAAIGTHQNGGAIALHSNRWPFYPGSWTEEEFDCFLARMVADDVPVFLLDDGPSMRPTIERLAAAGRLRLVARLDVPLPEGSSSTGQLYEVLDGEFGPEFNCEL